MTFSVSEHEEVQQQETDDMTWLEHAEERVPVGKDQLQERMQDMKDRYEGLVTSDEAAIILVAREEGVNLVQEVKDDPRSFELEVQNLIPGITSVSIRVSVEVVRSINDFGDGMVRSVEVSDSTGQTQISFWDEDAEEAGNLEPGDQLAVKNGYTKDDISDYMDDRFGVPAIQIGDDSRVEICRDEEWHDLVT